jgi:hypothetical protein
MHTARSKGEVVEEENSEGSVWLGGGGGERGGKREEETQNSEIRVGSLKTAQ